MILWNGIDLRTKGIIVERTPEITKGKKRITIYDIPGRSGFLSVDEGTYESFVMSIECHASEEANFNDISTFLDGYGTLSLDGEKEYTAIIQNAIPFSKVQMFKQFIVEFLVNPIAQDIDYEEVNISESSTELEINESYYEITPVLEIECSGDIAITINNNTFYLYGTDGIYILNSQNKTIVEDGKNVSNIMNGNFPTLHEGINNIDYVGDVTSFKIQYKKTYLVGI